LDTLIASYAPCCNEKSPSAFATQDNSSLADAILQSANRLLDCVSALENCADDLAMMAEFAHTKYAGFEILQPVSNAKHRRKLPRLR